MKSRRHSGIAFLLLVASPLIGSVFVGLPRGFLEFPPLVTSLPEHAPFSWTWFGVIGLLACLSALLLVRPGWLGFKRSDHLPPIATHSRFPAWGYIGFLLVVVTWLLAWNRFPWMGPLQDHTFFPLWFGYILFVDGMVYRLKGTSLLASSPRAFFLLFPASAIAWWYFEFLNRFVKNWWYEGAETFTPLHYVIFASLSFSTVLPAVFETADWLSCHRWFQKAYRKGPRWRALNRGTQISLLVAGVAGLMLMMIWPNELFFLTWVAPLMIAAASLGLAGTRTPFHDVMAGNYTRLFTLAVAALVCGLFWELWNFNSMPKWNYSVPYVDAFHVFEMPLLGFAGYLPFGPICWCVWIMEKALLPAAVNDAMTLSARWMAARDDG